MVSGAVFVIKGGRLSGCDRGVVSRISVSSVKSGERYIGLRVPATRIRIDDRSKCGEEKSRWIRCTHDYRESGRRKRERERESGARREIRPDISRITSSESSSERVSDVFDGRGASRGRWSG